MLKDPRLPMCAAVLFAAGIVNSGVRAVRAALDVKLARRRRYKSHMGAATSYFEWLGLATEVRHVHKKNRRASNTSVHQHACVSA